MRQTPTPLLVFLLLMGALLWPSRADAMGVELEARYWVPDINGSAALAELDPPPELDVAGLLGIEADGVPEARLTFRIFLGLYARVGYQTMSNSSHQTVEDTIGLPEWIQLGSSASTDLDVDYGRFALGWRFEPPEKIFSIDVFAEAKGLSGDAAASLTSPIYSVSVSESFEAVIPSVGAGAEIRPSEKWQIFGEASFEVGYDEADMTDWELGFRFFPVDTFGIGGGYRVMDVDGTIDEVLLEVDWKGFFLSGLLRF